MYGLRNIFSLTGRLARRAGTPAAAPFPVSATISWLGAGTARHQWPSQGTFTHRKKEREPMQLPSRTRDPEALHFMQACGLALTIAATLTPSFTVGGVSFFGLCAAIPTGLALYTTVANLRANRAAN
jgi:hypothetical protein